MLRNIITHPLLYVYISHICVTCVTLYKYMNKNKQLRCYACCYAGVTHWPEPLRNVPVEALS
jgi:hypothetical protein